MNKHLVTALLGAFVGTLSIVSCQYKPLCYHHDEHSLGYDVRVVADYEREWEYTYQGGVDWQSAWPGYFDITYDSLRPDIPQGLRAMVYFKDGHSTITNMAPGGGKLHLAQGPHDILFHNNDTEYIVFDEIGTVAEARATTRTKTRSSYMGSPYVRTKTKGEATVGSPDMLYGSYFSQYEMQKTSEVLDFPVHMRPLVYTYYIYITVRHGREYVALSRGALAGMASGVYLSDGHTSDEIATVLFDCTLTDTGAVAAVRSFGVPNFPNPNYTKGSAGYGLNLEFRLRNGRIYSCDRDLSAEIAAQPHGGVIIIDDIDIPDELGEEDSSGFEVDVDDWGPYTDIYLPM